MVYQLCTIVLGTIGPGAAPGGLTIFILLFYANRKTHKNKTIRFLFVFTLENKLVEYVVIPHPYSLAVLLHTRYVFKYI